jgi:quercetin dioxygenase-like cupin family protein
MTWMRCPVALACAWACACGAPTAATSPAHAPVEVAAPASPPAAPAVDAGVSQEETLAAIQKAMNDLAPVAQQCWAKAATERYDIEGTIEASVTVSAPVDVSMRVVGLPQGLILCMKSVLEQYTWAPPLRGQTFRLPFKFTAPDGQSVIDRQLVDVRGQGDVSIAVLLSSSNTGNGSASMFDLTVRAGGSTGMRSTDRAELWLFLGDAEVSSVALGKTPVHRFDMMYVGAGGARGVKAGASDLHAVLVAVPGGHEGAARAGALATPEVTSWRKAPLGPIVLPAAGAKAWTGHQVYIEAHTLAEAPLSASIATIPAGATIAEHVHAHETELLYVLEGSGTMTVAGTDVAITPTSVMQIPPNTPHSFVATTAVKALQVYTPPGPEQRFKAPPKP